MATEPFTSSGTTDNSQNVTTRISVELDPAVPTGNLLVVEHISGFFVVGESDVPDVIVASVVGGGEVYLPVQFASRPLNYGGQLGVARSHQFGSPARLYVGAGAMINVTADANTAGILHATAVGYLQ